jgi:hypothetical protein
LANRGTGPRPVDVTKAHDILDNLFLEQLSDTTALMVRDSALRFYRAPGITATDKAYAAFVVGQAYFSLKDRPGGCQWIRTAVELAPADNTYLGVRAQCPS